MITILRISHLITWNDYFYCNYVSQVLIDKYINICDSSSINYLTDNWVYINYHIDLLCSTLLSR